MTREQLTLLGLTRHGIQHRIARGRLHPVGRGIYAVGEAGPHPAGSVDGGDSRLWREGVAALSHSSAAALFKIGTEQESGTEVSRRSPHPMRLPGIRRWSDP